MKHNPTLSAVLVSAGLAGAVLLMQQPAAWGETAPTALQIQKSPNQIAWKFDPAKRV